MKPTPITCIVFDLDGTLVDSMSDFSTIAASTIHKHYNTAIAEAKRMYKATSGLPFRFQLEKMFPQDARNQKAAEEYELGKLANYYKSPFFTDVLSVFPTLIKAGFKLCISSNNSEALVIKKTEPLKDYFSLILGFKDGFLKGRDHFKKIQHELHCPADSIVFVGDSLNDARQAQQNKVAFIGRLGTFTQTDFDNLGWPLKTITDFYELLPLLT